MRERTISLNEHYFDSIDSPDKAYWLGFIATDGNVYDREFAVKLAVVDIAHLEKFALALGSEHPIRQRKNNFGREYALMRFKCKHLVTALAEHGIGPNKSFSVSPWNGPADLMPHYWRGAVDGDGWITVHPQLGVGFCGNQSMVEGFTRFVESLLPTEYTPKERVIVAKRRISQVIFGGSFVAKEVCKLLRYDDMTVPALQRKREKALSIMDSPTEYKVPRRNLTREEASQIDARWNAGETVEALAKEFNVGKGTVFNITRRVGRFAELDGTGPTRKTQVAIFSLDEARKMRLQWQTGDTDLDRLAQQYGVCKATVYHVIGRHGRYSALE